MEDQEKNQPKMDKNHKRALAILSLFSVAIIAIWFVNFFSNLNEPFNLKTSSQVGNLEANNCPGGNCSASSQLDSSNTDLKLVDTDSDGISDWDELFIYGSSPYLEDTDGDGLGDYEEIFVYKTDPNCLAGQTCSGASGQNMDQTSSSSIVDDIYGLEGELSPNDISAYLNSPLVDVAYLRQMLLEEGFSQNELDQISDEDLISIYKSALTEEE